jgi:hypothetical protein
MAILAQVTHRTRGRLRLRIPEKRRDLPFFLALYEELRQAPHIGEVVMNPLTGSVLLRFDEANRAVIADSLEQSHLIAVIEVPSPGRIPARAGLTEGGERDAQLARRATDLRAALFLVMLGLSVHQILRGHFFAPVLTLLLYGVDLAAGYRREKQAAPVSA